jgi:hypothetical protein
MLFYCQKQYTLVFLDSPGESGKQIELIQQRHPNELDLTSLLDGPHLSLEWFTSLPL